MSDKPQKTEEDHLTETRAALLSAALMHVPFDGWSDQCFQAALADSGVDSALARLSCPRGALDLALALYRDGDIEMVNRTQEPSFSSLRYSQKVAAMVRYRLEASNDKEVVRRGVTFFSSPTHAADGAATIWGTCDLIWKTLGDSSNDLNWYTKRAILSAVYSSTLLFWLGDESEGHNDTWGFLERRIENVMQFEKFKGGNKENPLFKGFMRGPGQVLDRIHAPEKSFRPDLPGHVSQKS